MTTIARIKTDETCAWCCSAIDDECPGEYCATQLRQVHVFCHAETGCCHEDAETCAWCGEPVTDDEPGQACSGQDSPVHPRCHWESGCTRTGE